MSSRIAGLCSRVLLPARIRGLKTMVVVASTNAKGDSSPLATLYADEDSRLGMIVREELIRIRHMFSHSGDFCNSSGQFIHGLPLPVSEDGLDDGVSPADQSGGLRMDDAEFNRLRDVYEKKVLADAAEAKRRDEVNSAEALARNRANHRFDMLEKKIQDGIQATRQEITLLKKDITHMTARTIQGLNEHTDALNAHTVQLKEQEKLQKEGAAKQDKLWVYEAFDMSIEKLPWGLPVLVKELRTLWANVCVVYPFYPVVAGAVLYIRNDLTPSEYAQILMYHHDELISDYQAKVVKLRQ